MIITDLSTWVDAELRAVFDGLDELIDGALEPERGRAFRAERSARLAALPRNPRVESDDVRIPSMRAGEPDVVARTYAPRDRDGALPGVIWLHGGGFSGGSIDADRGICERLADQVGAVVVAVEYRLSPEHVFPAAVEDAYSALVWLAASADALDVARDRIAVAGQSAGAALTASLTMMARDRGEVAIAFQAPIYGAFDDRLDTASTHQIMDPRSWNRNLAVNAWNAYLGSTDRPPRYSVPLREEDLSGLPPAYMMVGEFDMHRDENIEYAQKLLAAGVAVEFHVYPRTFHGFDVLVPDAAVSVRAIAEWQGALSRALHS